MNIAESSVMERCRHLDFDGQAKRPEDVSVTNCRQMMVDLADFAMNEVFYCLIASCFFAVCEMGTEVNRVEPDYQGHLWDWSFMSLIERCPHYRGDFEWTLTI